MIRLTDLQLVLLTSAAQRADGSLLPPSESIADQAARIGKAIPPLIKRRLVVETPTSDMNASWKQDGDIHLGVFITDAGRALLGEAAPAPDPVPSAPATTEAIQPSSGKPPSKTAMVLDMLCRSEGATLDELVAATRWLPHTTRAALTGLRKKGHAITRGKRGETTCYTIEAVA